MHIGDIVVSELAYVAVLIAISNDDLRHIHNAGLQVDGEQLMALERVGLIGVEPDRLELDIARASPSPLDAINLGANEDPNKTIP